MLVDDILIEIGEMGTYQIIMYILLGLAGLPTGKYFSLYKDTNKSNKPVIPKSLVSIIRTKRQINGAHGLLIMVTIASKLRKNENQVLICSYKSKPKGFSFRHFYLSVYTSSCFNQIYLRIISN